MTALYTNKDNTIRVDIDGGATPASNFISARYGLFKLGSDVPVFEATTPAGITTEGNEYVIKISKSSVPPVGDYYEEIEAVDANGAELLIHQGNRTITKTRL
jgi:hypothetical protein